MERAAAKKQRTIDIRVAAMQLASDTDICAIAGITLAELEPYRAMIEQTRARAMQTLRYQRALASARQAKREAGR